MKIRFYFLLVLVFFPLIYIGCSSSDSDPVAPSLTLPAAPDSLEVTTLSESSVQLQWNDNSVDEEGFQLEYSNVTNFQSYSGMDLDPDVTTVTVDDLEASTEYFFRIYSYNDDGDSDFSNVDSTVTNIETEYAPSIPLGLTATTVSDSEIMLDWTDTADNEEGFQLEYSTLEDFYYFYAVELNADAETTTIDELDGSTTYYFRIYAFNQFDESENSNIDSTTTDITPSNEPTAPDGLTLSVYSSSEIRAEWNDNSDDEENFVLQWSTTSDFAVEYSATIPLNTGYFTVTGLAPSTQYYFRVLAENSFGGSNWCATENITTIQSVYGDFSINSGADYINSRSVTLNNSMIGVTLMQFRDDTSGWTSAMSYSSTYTYTLTYGDGIRTVYARYYDSAGNLYERSDEISLDTVDPDIDSFSINNGDSDTYNSTVTLNNDVAGATKMRFSLNGISWSGWENFQLTKSWNIPEVEDTFEYVYAEYKDDHENTVSTRDGITYDKIRTIKIVTWAIFVDKAGDGGGTGEIYWEFRGANNETGQNFDISVIDRLDYISMPEETLHMIYDQYNPQANTYSTTVTRGESGNYINLSFRMWDNDGSSVYDDDGTDAGSMSIFEFENWKIGEFHEYWLTDSDDLITGYIKFITQEVD
ncbi:MAG: fibronectin type III domain-containing protein [Candidatus Delongbacteria bacterium]|jgi:hypothetical protein|nr:fibronectin type III domain-containing protein [Candidatus Delongbacteria bacterium]